VPFSLHAYQTFLLKHLFFIGAFLAKPTDFFTAEGY
jgi:hypothetical protein